MRGEGPETNGETKNGNKVLNAPVHLGTMAANLQENVEDIKSIWVMQRDDTLVSICNVSFYLTFIKKLWKYVDLYQK